MYAHFMHTFGASLYTDEEFYLFNAKKKVNFWRLHKSELRFETSIKSLPRHSGLSNIRTYMYQFI